jgi:hypothetical protein
MTNRHDAFDLLALRLNHPRLDAAAVSQVALSEPVVPLFRTGTAAARHGMKAIKRPGKKAMDSIQRLIKKRNAAGD